MILDDEASANDEASKASADDEVFEASADDEAPKLPPMMKLPKLPPMMKLLKLPPMHKMLAFGPGSLFIIFDILGLFILLMNCTDVDPTLLGTSICFLGSSWSDNIALVILLWLLLRLGLRAFLPFNHFQTNSK